MRRARPNVGGVGGKQRKTQELGIRVFYSTFVLGYRDRVVGVLFYFCTKKERSVYTG